VETGKCVNKDPFEISLFFIPCQGVAQNNMKSLCGFLLFKKLLSIMMSGVQGKSWIQCKRREKVMELAKVTLRGQITIPAAIRRKLKIREGDKVVFVEKDGRIFVENAAMLALREAQEGFRGETERAGLNSEKDVVTLVREVRKEIREENHAGDA